MTVLYARLLIIIRYMKCILLISSSQSHLSWQSMSDHSFSVTACLQLYTAKQWNYNLHDSCRQWAFKILKKANLQYLL